MQPGEAQKGLSSKSELFDSLKVYLNNKNRLQPIIGLGSIIECVKVGASKREAFYLCEVCVSRLSKADMRNHIMGSLHRYNYIKAWYPHLMYERKENADLCKMAWPLMEIAKTIEGKEGTGDIQLIEVEDAVYWKMATHSENDAVTLINSLRDGQGQGEPESHLETMSVQLEHYPIQSQKTVLLSQNQWRRSGKSFKDGMIIHKSSAQTNKPPPLIRSTVVPPINSEDGFKNISTSQLENTQMSPEPSVLSENRKSFLDCYTGTKPLIGLVHVVECRSEDGCTYIFLCHCCRIRSNKKDIIDHLTSSSHLLNYLMETHPEQVEVMSADINDNCQFLISLARKVEQEEGRGVLKVVNLPESLCIPLTCKSYHWCMKMLCNGWTRTSTQKNKTVKGPSVNKTSVEGIPDKNAVVLSKWAKRMTTKRKMRKGTNTVFKVSLPLTKGSVLLERMSFSKDNRPMSYSHSSTSDLIPLPKSQTEDSELDAGSFAINHAEHTSVCTTLQLQQDLYSGDAEGGQYMGPGRNFTVTQYQDVDDYSSDNEYFSQPEDIAGTKDQKVYEERNYDRQQDSQERSSKNFNMKLTNEDLQKQNEGLSTAVSHTWDLSSYNSYRREKGYTEHWYSSASQSKVGTRVEVSREERPKEMNSDVTQRYYQQQPQNQYMAPDHTSLQTGSVWHHSLSGEFTPHLDASRINMHPHSGDVLAHRDSIAQEPRIHFLDTEQRQLQPYMEFTPSRVQTTPQSYIKPVAYQAIQIGHGLMSDPNYSNGPRMNPDQRFPHPDSSSGGGGGMPQSNVFIPPVQALCYGTLTDLNFRD
ncbi:uncharacterized protein si:ch211-199g17.2 isoform X1 [Xiphias gladius]|uniref:uncharacterized protein si:ch211-199g17.2 isoform X1 n=1 Tax=Xiphias gladius TaxID=8245 RepID=UPI001A99F406|nr:uncharacterized protein si:ch211-199g17.2 isoform X1 [Xiphias gladius]XP_039977239.1 uncharacterized protein si:ch211-199g17.2 isoform X1 [Xiphias gladius]XP_039977240.1 uncharacterized protein si:ch211-199g17.2 isoform X1 [Xiphias gladius]